MARDKIAVLFTGICLGVFSYFLEGSVYLMIVFAAIAYLIYKNSPAEDRAFILYVLASGFLLRAGLSVALHVASYLKGYQGATSGDDLLYTLRSWALVYKMEGRPHIWIRAISGSSEYGLNPFTYLLAFFYKVFRFHPLSAKFINCIIGSLIGWLSYLMGKELFDRRAGRIAMAVVMFYPSLIRWSIANLKDALSILLLLLCVYILSASLNGKTKISIWITFLAGMSLLWLFPQRFYFLLVAMGFAIILFLKMGGLMNKRPHYPIFLAIALALFTSLYFLLANPKPLINILYLCEEQQSVIARSDISGYYLYTPELMISMNEGRIDILALAFLVAKSIAYFMLTPLPWQIWSRENIFACLQMPYWYLLLLLSILGMGRLFFEKTKIFSLLMLLLTVGIVINSLAEGNIGSAFRHRDVYTPFFAIFASGILSKLAPSAKKREPAI